MSIGIRIKDTKLGVGITKSLIGNLGRHWIKFATSPSESNRFHFQVIKMDRLKLMLFFFFFFFFFLGFFILKLML